MKIKIEIPEINVELPKEFLDMIISDIRKNLFSFQKDGVYIDRMQIFNLYEGRECLKQFKELINDSLGKKINIDEFLKEEDGGVMLQINLNPATSINLIQKFFMGDKVYNAQKIIRSLDVRSDSLFYGKDLTSFIKDKDNHLYAVNYVPGSRAYLRGDDTCPSPKALRRIE